MANKKILELLKECDKQSDSLYVFLGKFLYENISSGFVTYSFEPQDKALKAKVKSMFKNIAKDEDVKPLPPKSVASVKKNKAKAVEHSLGIERRGQLEPYTKLIVDLHILTNKLQEIEKDLHDSISPGLLYADSDKFLKYQQAIDKKISAIISLSGENKEVIKSIMKKKKDFFEANPKAVSWKAEDDFLKQAASKVSVATDRINRLLDDVAGIFEDIKELYEKGLRTDNAVQQNTPLQMPDDLSEQIESEELIAKDEEELIQQEEEASEEGQDEEDYGLFETASRKLSNQILDGEEKLVVLNAIFRNAPKKTIPFLYELVKAADVFLRKQLIGLLASLDYPEIIGLYRRFIIDDESALRLHGIMGLVKLKSGEAQHVLVSAINDKDLNVRRFIVNCLKHTGTEAEVVAIGRMANDTNEIVAQIAIRKLGLMANHFAFVNLVQKLDDPNANIRKEAILSLRAMTKTDLGYDYAASDLERKRKTQQWKALVAQSYTNPRTLHELRDKQTVSNLEQKKKSYVKNKKK